MHGTPLNNLNVESKESWDAAGKLAQIPFLNVGLISRYQTTMVLLESYQRIIIPVAGVRLTW
jgi:hypothetical protein